MLGKRTASPPPPAALHTLREGTSCTTQMKCPFCGGHLNDPPLGDNKGEEEGEEDLQLGISLWVGTNYANTERFLELVPLLPHL